MSFTYGGINTDDLEGVKVTPITYPNMGGLQLDTVPTPGRDGRFYGGSRMTTSQLPFRVTISGENQQQADLRRLAFMRMLDPSTGARSLRLDNTANWHYPQAVVAQQIEWEKHADRSKVMYDGEVMFETNFDAAMRQIDPSTVSGTGLVEFVADMGSTVSYPTIIFESGGDIRVRVNEFIVDLYDTPPDTYGVVNWDEYKFYTADADAAQSIVFEWEGTPHASPSEYLIGGEVVARNLVRNPSFTHNIGTWAAGSDIEWDSTGGYDGSGAIRRLGITENIQGVYNLPWRVPGISAGQKAAAKVRVKATAGARLHLMQNNLGTGTNFIRTDFTATGEWQEITASGGTVTSTLNPYILVRTQLTPVEPVDLWVDRAHLAVADTEQDALAQVEHYFDGDTVGHLVTGERISSLVNAMSHFERPAIYPGDSVEVEVTPIGSNTATPVIVYPNHRRL